LGIHLVDVVLRALDFPGVTDLSSRPFAQGALLNGRRDVVEDYATARFDLDTGATVNLACSWRLQDRFIFFGPGAPGRGSDSGARMERS